MRQRKLMLALGLIAISIGLRATDNAHYYKSANLHRHPSAAWFDDLHYYEIEDWFQKMDSNTFYGDSHSAWDKNGNSTNILNDTGAYDLQEAFQNVDLSNVKNPELGIVQNVKGLIANDANDFKLRFDGKFETWETNYQIRKNIKWGLFLEGSVPIRSLKVKDITYTDLTTGLNAGNQAEWAQFINNFDNVLNEFGYKPHNTTFSKTGLGDISVSVGWEDVFEKRDKNGNDKLTIWLAARAGILCPTGEREKTDYVFSMPTGYNEHWGLTSSLELDMGVLPWLSVDFFGGFTWFFDGNRRETRMKTSASQVGHMIMEKGIAKEDMGTLWYLGSDVKFDHFWRGLSAIVGYSYNRQEDTELTPDDTARFTKSVVNSYTRLQSWYTHVLHFMLDYDISLHMDKDSKWAPRVNVFFNLPVDGRNAYKTETFGAGFGIDMKW